MSFGTAVSTCLKKYGTFNGRAKRSEFWFFYLFTALVSGIPAGIGAGLVASGGSGGTSSVGAVIYGIAIVISLAFVIPTLAVGCRRLHDRGQSGWWQLLLLVPCANIVLIIFWAMAGNDGDNAYG